jgi:Pilus formation protein N terminal region
MSKAEIVIVERERVMGSDNLMREMLKAQDETNLLLRILLEELRGIEHHPVSITLTLHNGEKPMNTGQIQIATVTETDAAGLNFAVVPANLTFAIADPTIATVSSNNDGTATVTAVAPGTTTLTATDTVFNLTGSAGISVTQGSTADTPTSLTVTLGPATTPAAPATPANT